MDVRSIRVRLPVLFTGVLALFAVAILTIAYSDSHNAALSAARERLETVSGEMALIVDGYTERIRNQVPPLAQRVSAAQYLRAGGGDALLAAQRVLDSLSALSPLVEGLEIRDPSGVLLVSSYPRGEPATAHAAAQTIAHMAGSGDTLAVGAMHALTDSTGAVTAAFAVVSQVREGEEVLGHFVLHRRHAASATELQRIRELIGSDAELLVGSPETGVWTDLTVVAAGPEVAVPYRDAFVEYGGDGESARLASINALTSSPWVVMVAVPRDAILAAPHSLVFRLGAVSLGLLLIGAVVAWSVSRQITAPLAELAQGAEEIARGNYGKRVVVNRADELGVLGGAFNRMAERVSESVDRLAEDIARRKEVEGALRDAEEMIHAVLDASPLPVVAHSAEGLVVLWNRSAERVFGVRTTDVVGREFPCGDEDERRAYNAVLRGAAEGRVYRGWEHRRKGSDGNVMHFRLSAARTGGGEGKHMVTVLFEDVTQGRRLEEQARQSQKMEAVGRLAGGIAHDFNNILTVVLGTTDMLLHDSKGGDQLRHGLQDIRDAGERAAALTKQLLSFSRHQELSKSVFALDELVAGMERMLRRTLGEQVHLVVRLGAAGDTVEGDRGQLEQVLLNLVVNARDAMPGGGLLLVETARVVLDDEYARSRSGVQAGEHLLMSVSDTGSGMPEEVRERIFEPFFTTKAEGEGTGLGLATSYGIVTSAGGHIAVYSEPGVGTTMKVYLPLAGSEGVKLRVQAEALAGGDETVLVVDDDVVIRRLAARLLELQGYRVLQGGDVQEALAVLAAHPGEVDLLLTDVVIPEGGGRALASSARRVEPGLRVLFMSGYTADVVLHRGLLLEGAAVLHKPFSARTLSEQVRASLDGAAAEAEG